MSYLEPILLHPVRRQNFGDAVAQTCNPHLIPCHKSLQCETTENTTNVGANFIFFDPALNSILTVR